MNPSGGKICYILVMNPGGGKICYILVMNPGGGKICYIFHPRPDRAEAYPASCTLVPELFPGFKAAGAWR